MIDWDLQNQPSENVFVLGLQERYAIDNYILDPLAIGLLLLREKFVSSEEFGLPANQNYLAIAQAEPLMLEIIAKRVILDLSKKLTSQEKANEEDFLFSYSEGFSITCPKWLAILQGHRLQDALKETYPKLHRYRNEPDLKNEVIGKVFSDRPGIIPSAVVNAFREIQQRNVTMADPLSTN